MSIFLLLLFLLSPNEAHPPVNVSWTEHRMVAHAMGGIEGTRLTNSFEAFNENYRKGFRVFETDFRLTSDGYPVAVHDWGTFLYGARGKDKSRMRDRDPVSLKEFKSMRFNEKYRPLDMGDIVQLMERYPDVYIVTDTKDRTRKEIERMFRKIDAAVSASPRPDVRGRIVPQIYDRQMYEQLEKMSPFPAYIYTLYESHDSDDEVIRFLKKTPKIKAVTMPEYRVTHHFVSELKKLGVKTYVHTINDFRVYESYLEQGIDGIYTDQLQPEQPEPPAHS